MQVTEQESQNDWKAWRRERRRERIAARKALSDADRRERNKAIDAWLAAGFAPLAGYRIGFCWPFAAEPDPRFAIRRWREQGSRVALPVVVAPRTPLAFREWWPGAPMANGVYDIPYPVDTPQLELDAVLVPVNGFDEEGYRLGYGGGYFDRTLASLARYPVCIGLGYETARMETIHPKAHDIPFDFMVTEAGIRAREDGLLRHIDSTTAAERVAERLGRVDTDST